MNVEGEMAFAVSALQPLATRKLHLEHLGADEAARFLS